MAWKRLTVGDLRLALAEDEIEKLSTRSLDQDIQDVLQDQLDMAADAFRGAWLSKGYEVDVRAHYVAPEYRQFVLDYARYQIWTRFPMAEDYALSKPREEAWKTAVEMLKNPYLATSRPDYSDDPSAAEEAKKRADASVSMPWLRMPGEAGEYGFPAAGGGGSAAKDVDPSPSNWMRYLSAWVEQPALGSVCKTDTHWKIFTVDGWENLADLSVEWSDISGSIDWNQLSSGLGLGAYAKKEYVDDGLSAADAKMRNYLPLSGGTVTGTLALEGNDVELRVGNGGVDDQYARLFRGELQVSDGAVSNTKLAQYLYDKIQVTANGSTYTLILPLTTGTLALAAGPDHAGNLAALDENGNPVDSGVKPSGKLDSAAAAPAVLSTQTYAEGEYATHSGKLYVCSTAVSSPGDWPEISSNWTETDMTTPDATLDVTADRALRVVAADGTVLWRQGYDMALSSSATLSNECVNKYTFDQNPTSAVALTLPVVPYGKCADFVLDAVAPAEVSAAFDLDLNSNSFVVDAGKDLQDVVSMQAGEIARYWFTLTTFDIDSKPTWQVSKTVVVSGDLS